MCGRTMAHRLMGWSAQTCPSLPPLAEVLGYTGPIAPASHQAADVETPMGSEILHHPVIALHIGELLDHGGQMGGTIGTGTSLAQSPPDLTRGHHKRGEQRPHPMSHVLVRAFLRFPWGNGRGGICALEKLPTGLFIGADDHTTLRKAAEGVAR
jgi:hypothetical protein